MALKLGAKSAAMFVLGISLYLYVPIASMTNPPVNWGYPRTVEGFYHVLGRGQYERVHPTSDLGRLLEQLGSYAGLAARDFGWLYLAAALVPFCVLRRMGEFGRRWTLAMTGVLPCPPGVV